MAWQLYKASNSDEITLKEGDIVELIDTNDPTAPASKYVICYNEHRILFN